MSSSAEQAGARQTSRLYRVVWLLFGVALLYRFFDRLVQVALITFVGVIVAMALHRLVALIPVRRGIATTLVFLTSLLLVVIGVWQGVRLLLPQLESLIADLPALRASAEGWFESFEARTGIEIDPMAPIDRAVENPTALLTGVLGHAFGLFQVLGLVVIVVIGAFFVAAKPNEQLLDPLLRAVPGDRRPAVRRAMDRTAERLVGWLKGTLISMVVVGVLSGVAFWLLGAPYALVLGVFVGLTEVIPLVGPWIGGGTAVLVTLLRDPQAAWQIAIAVLVIQQLEGSVIRPFVMSGAAELHPFVTIVALLLFGSLFGFLGALLALPITLALATLVEVFWVEETIGTDEEEIEPQVKT